jgi:4'-phosphopantetheinyl transferase
LPEEEAVLVWTLALDAFEGALPQLERLLAPAERERAEGLPPRRAGEFVVTRAALRAVLADRTGTAPQDISIANEASGKPTLEGPGDLHFNVSHAGAVALVALSARRTLGVDVEEVRPRPRLERIALRVFSPAERERLGQLEGRDQLDFFYGTWTAREACLKVTGQGMPAGPEGFDVPAWPAGLDHAVEVSAGGHRYALRRWAPANGYLAAVAAPGPGLRLVPSELPSRLAQARSL